MAQTQILSRNQQIVLDIIEKAKGPLKAYSILFNVQKKGINAPPIQINIKSISLTASISPNNNPITSNLIDVKKPKITKPTANEACASKPVSYTHLTLPTILRV